MTSGSLIGSEYYQIAWLIYILAGAGFLAAVWRPVRLLQNIHLKRYILVFIACGIYTPSWQSGPDGFVAPAILVTAFDFLDGLDKGLNHAMNILVQGLLPMVLLMLVFACVFVVMNIRGNTNSQQKQQPQQQSQS